MDETDCRIRPAAAEEVEALSEIAVASKGYWGYDAEFMERFAELMTLTPDYVHDHEAWVVEDAGTRAGFYGLIHHGEVSELDDLWVLPEHIGHGLGRALFEHAVGRARDHGARRLELEAEIRAIGFYERMGARHLRDTISALGRTLPIYGLDLR